MGVGEVVVGAGGSTMVDAAGGMPTGGAVVDVDVDDDVVDVDELVDVDVVDVDDDVELVVVIGAGCAWHAVEPLSTVVPSIVTNFQS